MSENKTTSDDKKTIKVEFAVQMHSKSCETAIADELKLLKDIHVLDISSDNQKLLLQLSESSSSVHEIQDIIESKLGLNTVVKGLGDSIAAVSEITGTDNIVGVVRFTQLLKDLCLVDGVIDGIAPQKQFSLNIHEFGDLSGQAFENVGKVYVPIAGQLNAIDSTQPYRASIRAQVSNCDLSACIGRSLAVSLKDRVIGAGIVARASNIGDNTKRICACSGRTLWEERAIKAEDRSSRL